KVGADDGTVALCEVFPVRDMAGGGAFDDGPTGGFRLRHGQSASRHFGEACGTAKTLLRNVADRTTTLESCDCGRSYSFEARATTEGGSSAATTAPRACASASSRGREPRPTGPLATARTAGRSAAPRELPACARVEKQARTAGLPGSSERRSRRTCASA